MLECVVNISEGRRLDVVDSVAASAGVDLLDVHHDGDHHRSVLTLVGQDAARSVAATAVAAIDLRTHRGAHPRLGAVDVVPFVPLGSSTLDDALAARDAFGAWAGRELGLPCFVYGPERSLPDVRRHAFVSLQPDYGPGRPHPDRRSGGHRGPGGPGGLQPLAGRSRIWPGPAPWPVNSAARRFAPWGWRSATRSRCR